MTIERIVKETHTLVIDRTGPRPIAYRVPHGKPEPAPGVMRKAANFTRAAARHVAAGRPIASQEVIDERFAVCDACDYLDRDKMSCKKCGCGIKNVVGKFSKLTWADSKCPDLPPRWVASNKVQD